MSFSREKASHFPTTLQINKATSGDAPYYSKREHFENSVLTT